MDSHYGIHTTSLMPDVHVAKIRILRYIFDYYNICITSMRNVEILPLLARDSKFGWRIRNYAQVESTIVFVFIFSDSFYIVDLMMLAV